MKDVLIVGSGAGGGPLAAALAEAGFTVQVFEKGPEHTADRYVHDEIAFVRRDFFNSSLADEPHMLLRRGEARPERSNLGWIARCVGGGTVHMAGYFYRLHPDDFRMRTRFGAYEALADWPFDYRELEPYYTKVEWEIGVSGAADREPPGIPRSRPYPLPPVDVHPLAALIDEACGRIGLRAFPSPRAILSRPYRGRPACAYCDFCGSYGCEVGAKSNSQTALLPRARATGRAEIVPDAMVKEITVDPRSGRATGCVYLDRDGVEREARGRVVCVCASAVESARLLLMSRSGRFPDGLANNAGQVGRNLQFQAFSTGAARFRYANHPDKPLKARHPFLGRSVRDYYFLPREGIAPIAKGGLIRFGFPHANPIYTAVRLAHADGATVWGPLLKERLREYYHDYRMIEFEAFHDFVPNDRTFVSLDPEVKDKYGLPAARIHLDESEEQHERAGRWLMERGLEVLHGAGADELVPGVVGGVTGHLVHGTCRAGRDPETSVLNEFCQAHEVPNLYVVDGSFMPTSGGVPTTLTIMANSFRAAERIAARLKLDK